MPSLAYLSVQEASSYKRHRYEDRAQERMQTFTSSSFRIHDFKAKQLLVHFESITNLFMYRMVRQKHRRVLFYGAICSSPRVWIGLGKRGITDCGISCHHKSVSEKHHAYENKGI